MTKATGERYDRATIGLHWATAVLVVVLWTSGQLADLVPKGPLRTDAWSSHFVLGFALAAVLIWRLVWRYTGGRACLPPVPASSNSSPKRRPLRPLSPSHRDGLARPRQRLRARRQPVRPRQPAANRR